LVRQVGSNGHWRRTIGSVHATAHWTLNYLDTLPAGLASDSFLSSTPTPLMLVLLSADPSIVSFIHSSVQSTTYPPATVRNLSHIPSRTWKMHASHDRGRGGTEARGRYGTCSYPVPPLGAAQVCRSTFSRGPGRRSASGRSI